VIDLVQNTFVDWIDDPCVGTTLTNVAYFPNGAAAMPDLGPDCASMGLSGFTPDPSAPSFSFTNLHDTNDPFDVAIDPTGSYALVTMELDHKLYRIDFGVSVTNMDLSSSSAGVAITHDGKTAVVAEASLDFIDTATGAVTPVDLYQDTPGTDFHNVAITPDDEVAVVVGTASIQFVSLADGKVLAAYPAAGNSVAISVDGSYAFVTDRVNGYVRVVPIP
jgi:DNA-binding beta-propeller fold protein YncE